MEDSKKKILFDKVANKIQEKSEEINEILSNCSITCNFLSEENQSKLEEVFNIDPNSVILRGSSDEMHDSKIIDSFFEMLGTKKPQQQQPQPRLIKSTSQRSVSVNSLALSEHDHQENINEVKRQMMEVKSVLENIKDCPLTLPEMNDIVKEETEKKSKFTEVVFSLQKLAKDLQSIAATDNLKNKEPKSALPVTKDLLDDLNHLSLCLQNLQDLDANKNLVGDIAKKDDLKFQSGKLISTILIKFQKAIE